MEHDYIYIVLKVLPKQIDKTFHSAHKTKEEAKKEIYKSFDDVKEINKRYYHDCYRGRRITEQEETIIFIVRYKL